MGWLSGVLSGYSDRQGEIRKENAQRAEESATREAAIYQALLNHDDPKIRGMAATGIMQLGQPRKNKGGFSGWMGEMESSPIYPTLMKYMSEPQRKETITPGLPSTQLTGFSPLPGGTSGHQSEEWEFGKVPDSAWQIPRSEQKNPDGSPAYPELAQPATSPTQGGPMASPQPMPGAVATPPPSPPPALAALTPEELAGTPAAAPAAAAAPSATPAPAAASRRNVFAYAPPAPPAAPAAPAPAPAAAAAPAPAVTAPAAPAALATPPPGPPPSSMFTVRQVPGPAVGRTDVTYEQPNFPTEEERATKLALAKERADYLAAVEMFKRSGEPDPEKAAADFIVASKQRAAGGVTYKPTTVEFTGADGQVHQVPASFNERTGRYHDMNGNPLPPDAQAVAKGSGSGRALNKREEIALEKFGDKYGFKGGAGGQDPRTIMARLSPKEHGIVLREEGVIAAEAALAKAEAMQNAPLTALARSNLTEKLSSEWREITKPQRDMKRQLDTMQAALGRLSQDPNGAGQAILMTFNRILDPNSVVREGEYDRSIHGISVIDRVKGWWEKYGGKIDPQTGAWIGGGVGIPREDLEAMALTARNFAEGLSDFTDQERTRIEFRANQHSIPSEAIFGTTVPQANPGAGGGGGGAAGGGAGGAAGGGAKQPPPANTGNRHITMGADGTLMENGAPWKP